MYPKHISEYLRIFRYNVRIALYKRLLLYYATIQFLTSNMTAHVLFFKLAFDRKTG
jgi:hypothetical protein